MNIIQELQGAHKEWVTHNFPRQQHYEPLLGIAEEVGELCHAHLKHEQGIRGMTDAAYVDKASDALGDIFIYMLSYANTNGFNLSACILKAWAEVSEREWVMPPSGEPL